MRMCAVNDLQAGDILGKSIVQANNRLLLGAGFRITNEIKAKLSELRLSLGMSFDASLLEEISDIEE